MRKMPLRQRNWWSWDSRGRERTPGSVDHHAAPSTENPRANEVPNMERNTGSMLANRLLQVSPIAWGEIPLAGEMGPACGKYGIPCARWRRLKA